MAFQLDVTSYLDVHRRTLKVSFATAVFIGTVGAFLIGSLVTDQLRRPETPSGPLLVILSMLALVFLMLPILMVGALSKNLRTAMAQARGKPLLFVADEWGLQIPLLILTEPVFSRLLAERQSELRVPWSDVTGWLVQGAVADRQPQHLLSLRSESERLRGIRNFGILRAAIGASESELLDEVKKYMSGNLEYEKRGWLSAG